MSDRQFVFSGQWALGADELQWILYRRRSRERGGWQGVSFVRSERAILERCMRGRAFGKPPNHRLMAMACRLRGSRWNGRPHDRPLPVLDPRRNP